MKQLIYIPTKVEDELPPFNQNIYLTRYEKGEQIKIGDFSLNMSNTDGVERPTEWLKPTEANVFTDSELLELKKKWSEEALNAGRERIGGFWNEQIKNWKYKSYSDFKQTFLNSITIDLYE